MPPRSSSHLPPPVAPISPHCSIVRRRPQVTVDASATQSLERAKVAQVIEPQANVADMLGTLHAQAALILRELALAEEPLAKRIAMAKDVAKLLPLLDRAERRCGGRIKDKNVDDMSDKELRLAYKALKGGKRAKAR